MLEILGVVEGEQPNIIPYGRKDIRDGKTRKKI